MQTHLYSLTSTKRSCFTSCLGNVNSGTVTKGLLLLSTGFWTAGLIVLGYEKIISPTSTGADHGSTGLTSSGYTLIGTGLVAAGLFTQYGALGFTLLYGGSSQQNAVSSRPGYVNQISDYGTLHSSFDEISTSASVLVFNDNASTSTTYNPPTTSHQQQNNFQEQTTDSSILVTPVITPVLTDLPDTENGMGNATHQNIFNTTVRNQYFNNIDNTNNSSIQSLMSHSGSDEDNIRLSETKSRVLVTFSEDSDDSDGYVTVDSKGQDISNTTHESTEEKTTVVPVQQEKMTVVDNTDETEDKKTTELTLNNQPIPTDNLDQSVNKSKNESNVIVTNDTSNTTNEEGLADFEEFFAKHVGETENSVNAAKDDAGKSKVESSKLDLF